MEIKLSQVTVLKMLRNLTRNFLDFRGEDTTLHEFIDNHMSIFTHLEKDCLKRHIMMDPELKYLEEEFPCLKMARVRSLRKMIKDYKNKEWFDDIFAW